MMIQPLPIAGKLPIKTLVAKQLPTNIHTYIHTYIIMCVYSGMCIYVCVYERDEEHPEVDFDAPEINSNAECVCM